MAKAELLYSGSGQRACRSRGVLDLSSIYVPLRELGELAFRYARTVLRRLDANLDTDFLQERAPDLQFRAVRELTEVQRDVNAREECLVERLDSVRGQEKNPAVVLKMP